MASLTRFKGRDGRDGPVSGALVIIPLDFAAITNTATVEKRVDLPDGMSFEITDIEWSANTVVSDPSLTIGDSAGGTQVVAAVNLATNTGALTIKDGRRAYARLIA